MGAGCIDRLGGVQVIVAESREATTESEFWREQRDAFLSVQRFLNRSLDVEEARAEIPLSCGLHRRLVDCVAALGTLRAGPADLAALLRSALRREALRPMSEQPGRARLTLNADQAASLAGVERQIALDAVSVGASTVISAAPWNPTWLGTGASDATDAMELRRLRLPAPKSDLFFRDALGFQRYASSGQALGARCVELSAQGSTILVSLPTGSGKSAIGLFGSLRPGATGTTVVVVPTVSLARDQEAHLCEALDKDQVGRELTHRDFAHLGSTDDEVKASIRARIREGGQGVVFVAPESLRTLAWVLSDAARQGLITDFVVDEAHAVLGWGVDFRPDFQTIAGLRRGLLEACPDGRSFRTILQSATITDHAAGVLHRLFGAETDHDHSLGVDYAAIEGTLRAEPDYFIVDCVDEAERAERVIETLFHVPRPAIVYVTNPPHANALVAALRECGFYRVASYTGTTSARDRTDVEEGWKDAPNRPTRYDVVVATSAFGLGIDQADVRAVIHGSTPETASRFYQEVGRGGRDGRACLSVLFTARRDLGQCRKLAFAVYPGPIVRSRWDSMFMSRVAIEDDERSWVDLDDVRPELLAHGVPRGSQRNRLWNQRVLTLLSDAELISLDTPATRPPPEHFQSPVGIRLLRSDMLEGSWDESWALTRARGSADAEADFDAMQSILRGRRCVAEELAERFAMTIDGIKRLPAAICQGCPWCRRHGRLPYAEQVWVAASAQVPVLDTEVGLRAALQVAPARVLAVVAESNQTASVVESAINLSRSRGVLLATSAERLTAPSVGARRNRRPGLADEGESVAWTGVPGVIEVVVGVAEETFPWILNPGAAAIRVLVVSRDDPSPPDPHRALLEMRPIPVLYADQFISLAA